MRLSSLFGSALALSLPFAASAASHAEFGRRHDAIARRARNDVNIFKRFDNARFTFYDVGLGACGQYNVASDFIVALNSAQYGGGYPGPNCFKSITISYGGKTAQATIMDECPGCPYGGLDFSRGLFTHFASEDAGVIYGQWWFNDGGDAPQTTKQADPTTEAPPKTTKKTTKESPTPTPTPTPTPEPSPEPEPTTTSSSSSSSKKKTSSSSSVAPSTSSAPPSSSSVPPSTSSVASSTVSSTSATPSATAAGAVGAANQAMLGLTGLLVAGAGSA